MEGRRRRKRREIDRRMGEGEGEGCGVGGGEEEERRSFLSFPTPTHTQREVLSGARARGYKAALAKEGRAARLEPEAYATPATRDRNESAATASNRAAQPLSQAPVKRAGQMRMKAFFMS